MRIRTEGIKLIKQAGGVFLRRGKHGPIYELPNGHRVSFSGTPGDVQAVLNLRSELRRLQTP